MDAVDRVLARLAEDCTAEFGAFTRAAAFDLRAEVPELAALGEQAERVVTEHAVAIQELLAAPVGRERVRVAPITETFARDCARREMPAATVLRAYQRGHELLWIWWSARVVERVPDPATRAAVTARLGEVLLAYVSVGMALTVEVHTAEREALGRGASWRQRETALAILRVGPGGKGVEGAAGWDEQELSRRLGYPLDRWHVGFALWREGEDDDWTGLDTAAREWTGRVGEQLLVLPGDGGAVWGWVPGATRPAWPDAPAPSPGPGLRVSVGQPGFGVAGFRASHREALRARAVAGGRDVARHAELATVALLDGDREQLARYLERALGRLAAAGQREGRLRDTVRAYLNAGENVRAAARELRFHRNTVQQRLEAAALLRGRPLGQDRLELALALEIAAHYGDEVLRAC